MGHDDRPAARWEQTIPELFANQSRRRPQAIAVSAGGDDVTYAELDERSDRIATWLADQGVGVDDVVAIRLDRGHDLIVALLGTAKAGAAYLALEADMPQARRDHLISVADAVALITGDDSAVSATQARLPTLRLPGEFVRLGSRRPAPGGLGPDCLAYVSFTSGSTGRPKGVSVPHRGVARLVAGGFADVGPDETFLLLSPVAFDASTFEIWASLLTGGRLVVHPPGPLDAGDLAALLAKQAVTTAYLPAALFHQMVQHCLEDLGSLRQLLAGGEPLNPGYVNQFVSRFPQARLVNGFGHTENTTFTTCYTVREPVLAGSVPVGHPIAGTQVRVLDARLNPTAPGERGDLYAAGAGLSRGYLKEPVATALSFVPDPFADVPGARMYRTGDMVRCRPSGELEFLGRSDHQLKIRGYRVDPCEVERELSRLAGVRQAVVIGRRNHAGENRLTAYVAADSDFAADSDSDRKPDDFVAGIRRGLRDVLPSHMIPAVFIPVEEFPLTANGKVDTALLPVPQRNARQADTEYVAPRSATEQLLCDLWADALGIDRVGIIDDYFDLGGNSLIAIDLSSRIESTFGVELPSQALYYHPTVEELAGVVDGIGAGK